MAHAQQLPSGYPSHRVVDVVLRDGSTVRVRPVQPDDSQLIMELFGRVSSESSRMRFHGMTSVNSRQAEKFSTVDYHDTFGLVVETAVDKEPAIIGLANYVRTGDSRAEMALIVDDPFHGKGIGSILVEHLAEAAVEAGITTFEAEVLAANADMLDVIRGTKLPLDSKLESGVIHFEFPTSPTPEAIDAFERREAVAAAAGVRAFLAPTSVAVVGASRRRGTIGGEIFRNLLRGEFAGPVYPVNPSSSVVQSVTAYPSVTDVPGPVDLAVIVVPADGVQEAALECARKGVRALLVISAGFSETGAEGAARQRALLDLARAHGMRIVGPNCMGMLNTDPEISLNATFAPSEAVRGRLAFSSQSGALGIAVIDRVSELGLGLSSFVSVGNKADISGNDLLQYWENDAASDVILLYLESFGNPRKFARIARRVSKTKPIVAVKSGRSEAGARAAASHTGSLVAGDVAVDALFRQAGVIRTDTLEELFDVASLVSTQPLPMGRRVAILTNAGGLGILCADACEAAGLEVTALADDTVGALQRFLASEASVRNPVDMIASATAEQYGRALEILVDDPNVDSIIVIFIPPLVTRAQDVARTVVEGAARARGKTILSCFLGVHGIHDLLRSSDTTVPSYMFPESAARALARVVQYSDWRKRPEGEIADFEDIDRSAAMTLVGDLLHRGEGWLDPAAVSTLLACYGISSARSRAVGSVEEVEEAAREIGGTVVIKIDSRKILHKTDVGGVRVGLTDPSQALAAAKDITESLRGKGLLGELDGFLVQEMVSAEGAEMFVGMTQDPSFGPLLACGAGGTLVELLRDVAVRITPLTDIDAREMIRSLNTYPVLEGYRGRGKLDVPALEELLLRLSAMIEDLPHISEVDLNPVVVLEPGKGCSVLDARIRLSVPGAPTPRGARLTRS